MMENVRKIKIKLENIWIDLIRSIYTPYSPHTDGFTQPKLPFPGILWHGLLPCAIPAASEFLAVYMSLMFQPKEMGGADGMIRLLGYKIQEGRDQFAVEIP